MSAKIDPSSFYYNEKNFLYVIRGLFDVDKLYQLKQRIAKAEASLSDDEKSNPIYREYGVAPNKLRLDFDLYNIWGKEQGDVLSSLVAGFDKVIFPPQIRTVSSDKAFVAWHQDNAYMKAVREKSHDSVVTCFVSLEQNLAGKPSLQFFKNEEQVEIEHIVIDGAMTNWFDLEPEDYPDEADCCSFDLQFGDALVFGQDVLHRTFLGRGSRLSSRKSMEFRLTKAESLVGDKDYFDLSILNFIRG